eukprot:CAMPEP_0198268158 /NCGR_PEP_ID=MMETSP1447-20131203/36085_1 /TAXON_ID=420782 /ORGANISM="Chaetoceros dichaeta, Strain CCMP1751" /LENGTH=186 /DNA_ID=CAMNT_0043959071 /DNA_START=38 /DNA_END=598 /DNA_ORIENTATION=+
MELDNYDYDDTREPELCERDLNGFGQRLYEQGLASEKKKAEARMKAASFKPQLRLATRSVTNTSRDSSPRYSLYELAKERQNSDELMLETSLSNEKSVASNDAHKRLYNLSSDMQQRGKEKREEIEKSKAPKPSPPRKKISPRHATNLYNRLYANGMKKQMELDRTRSKVVPDNTESFNLHIGALL